MKLAVYVTPKASRDEVSGWRDDGKGGRELCVRVSAAPEKGKATKAVCRVLAAFFDVPRSSVTCTRGETSRHKTIELPLDEARAQEILSAKLG